jgi:hypothetical protein
MSRRSRRLQERETTQGVDEGKVEDHRLSAGNVMGLYDPVITPNLRTTQAMLAAEAAAETLNIYNVSEHADDGKTNDEKEADDVRMYSMIISKPKLTHNICSQYVDYIVDDIRMYCGELFPTIYKSKTAPSVFRFLKYS